MTIERVGTSGGVPVQRWARAMAVMMLLSAVCGAIGEAYLPGRLIVVNDAAATWRNLTNENLLYRLAFAAYLVEAVCDVMLALGFYVLLKPVHRNVALMAALFGVLSTAVFAVGEGVYMVPALLLRGRAAFSAFSDDQLKAMALLALRASGYFGSLFLVFYGVASVLRGWLLARSTFLPTWLGVLLMIAGLGFIANSYAVVLAPGHVGLYVFALPMFLALLAMMVWFAFKGVDVARWKEAADETGPW